MDKKIYIIGPTGVGKSTFANKLSNKYNVKWYELDKVYWDDDKKDVRDEKESLELFNNILKNDSWIIEDVGRDLFKKGRKEASIIYYLKAPKIKAYFQITKRVIKEKEGFKVWKSLIKTSNYYYSLESSTLDELQKYKDKLKIVNSKDIDRIIGSN